MKNVVMILLVGATLVGCAAGGGASAGVSSGTVPVVPGCKSINSLWSSTTDSERHDFTAFAHGITVEDYEYRAPTGLTCGYANNPNHALRVQMYVRNLTRIQDPRDYDYVMGLTYSLAIGGACDQYGDSAGDLTQNAMIKHTCNEIQICRVAAGSGNLVNCKTFN